MAKQWNQRLDRRPRAVGAYIFAGGFTLGIKRHFNVVCHLEGDRYGVDTMTLNQPEIPIYVGVENWPTQELAKHDIDLIYGNPPCAAWSMAGRRGESWRTDHRVECTRNHFTLLETINPKIWVWESVTGAYTRGRDFVDHLTERANGLGYSVSYLLHDGLKLGLPSRRKRFFFVAHRGALLAPPAPQTAPMTVREAFKRAGVPSRLRPADTSENRHLWLLDEAPQGAQMYKTFDRLRPGKRGPGSGRPGYLPRRLAWDEPAMTFAGGAWFHPSQKRQLSMAEYQVLCGFSPEYEFTPRADQAKMNELARGVTPPVAEWLARYLLESLAPSNEVTNQEIDIT